MTDEECGPLFPKGIGEILHAIWHPEPAVGVPYTHLIALPPTEYDNEGASLPWRFQPSCTGLPRGVGKNAYLRALAGRPVDLDVVRAARAEVRNMAARDPRCGILRTLPHRLTNSSGIDRLLT